MSTDAVTATPPGTAEPLADTDSRVGAPTAAGVVDAAGATTLAERGMVLPTGGWDRGDTVGVTAAAAGIRVVTVAVVMAVVMAVVVAVIVTVAVILEMGTATATGAADVGAGLLGGAAVAAACAGAGAGGSERKALTTSRTAAMPTAAKPARSASRGILRCAACAGDLAAATAAAAASAGTVGAARRKGFGRSPAVSSLLSECGAASSAPAGSLPQGMSSLSAEFTGLPTRRVPDRSRCRCRGLRDHVGGPGG